MKGGYIEIASFHREIRNQARGGEMKIQQGFEKRRRDFLRILGIGGGAVFLSGADLPFSLAKDLYPANKVQWICYSKPGGGLVMIAIYIIPFLGT